MKIKREIKIGIIFALGIALLYYGLYFLKGINVFKKQNYYFAVYDRVDGLVRESPVNINGLKVGQVKNIAFDEKNANRIVVEFTVDKKISLPNNSLAMLLSTDLIGSKAIEIKLGDSKKAFAPSDTLKTEIEKSLTEQVSIQMLPVKRKAEDLMLSIDSVLAIVQNILNENTRQNIMHSFESIKLTFQNLGHTTATIDTLVTYQTGRLTNIFGNVESITLNIKKNNEKLSNILQNFSTISDSIAKSEIAATIANTNQSLQELSSILGKINNNEGTLGKLVNDDSLYNNLDASAKQLDLLLEDLRMRPDRYLHFSVFGSSEKESKKKKKDK